MSAEKYTKFKVNIDITDSYDVFTQQELNDKISMYFTHMGFSGECTVEACDGKKQVDTESKLNIGVYGQHRDTEKD